MPLICCGIDHRTGSLVEREPFQLQRDELAHATAEFKCESGLDEVVLLATCNRVEFYCYNEVKSDLKELIATFYRARGVDAIERLIELFFVRQGTSAARHLFKVICGLDSPLIGEYQVLGQVKEAYSASCSVSGAGRFLHKLFHHAFQIAKQVRSETEIGSGVQGLAGASLELVSKHFAGELTGRNALIVGANKSAEMLLARLTREKVKVTVANRTLYSAEKIVRPYTSTAISLDDLQSALVSTDILFSATSTPEFVIRPEHIQLPMRSEGMVAVDLAIPRDIDPEIRKIENVVLFDLDDLKHYLDLVQHDRAADLPYALDLIEEQVRSYEFWRSNTITNGKEALRQMLDRDRKELLEKFRDGFRQSDRKTLDAFSKNLYRQFLRRMNNSSKKE